MAAAFTLEMLVVDAFEQAVKQIEDRAGALGNDPALDRIGNEELARLWTSDFLLEPIEWDSDRESELARDEVITQFGRTLKQPESSIRLLHLPVVRKRSNPRVLTLRPEKGWIQRGPNIGPTAAYRDQDSVIILRGTKEELVAIRSTAETLVKLINEDIATHFSSLYQAALRTIQHRRQQLSREEDSFRQDARDLGVNIRVRKDAPRLVDVREREEVLTLRRSPNRSSNHSEPYLSHESTLKIVDLIDRAGKGFEVAPKEFLKLGEEGLRHVLICSLNAVFESTDATGETFSKDGKPDLVIIRDGYPVLVAECKFWDGPALYGKTLGKQLMRYIPWRHSKAVLITFSKRPSLTKVVRDAKQVTQSHSSIVGGMHERSETYFVSEHVHPDDQEKSLEIHPLFFNLFVSPAE